MHALLGGEVQTNVSQSVFFVAFFHKALDAGAKNGRDFVEAFSGGHTVGVEGVRYRGLSSGFGVSHVRLII